MGNYVPIDAICQAKVVVVADIETTGFSPEKGASLLEIGAVKIDVESKKIIDTFSRYVHPTSPYGKVPNKITELTSITTEMIQHAQEPEEVLESFFSFVGQDPIAFHNAKFDWDRFLFPGFETVGKHATNTIICTQQLSKKLHPELSKHGLAAMTALYGHPIIGHHRAVVDCKYTASLYLSLRDKLLAETICDDSIRYCNPAPQQNYNMNDFRLFQIKTWAKKQEKRTYVYTSAGVFCFDEKRGIWTISELRTQNNLSKSECVSKILELARCSEEHLYNNYSA